MTLRLDDADDAALAALAQAHGISKNEAALRAIREARRRAEDERALDLAITDTLTRYPDTIRRLGE